MLALMAVVSVAGCHRRTFEDRAAREDVIITSTTVITSADVPSETAEAQTPAPAPRATPTMLSEPLPPAPSEADRTAQNLGLGDAGSSTTASPPPAPAPPQEPQTTEPPRRRASAADPIPWAGDSYVRSD